MSRLIPHTDMTAKQLLDCSYQAQAIIALCESAAWAIQNGGEVSDLSDAIGSGLRLATELLAPVHDALEHHEGVKGGET